MTPPIRTDILVLTKFSGEPGDMTLRQMVDWFKRVIDGTEPLGMLTKLEHDYINEQYGLLCKEVAKAQGIPSGMLSYFVGELAQTELRLRNVAATEFVEATGKEPE